MSRVLILLAALWVTGVVVATPFVVWWARDFDRIPGRIWYWSGYDRRAWQWAVFLGFLAGGVIAIVTVLRWRRSDARTELLDDLHERIAAHDARVAAEAASGRGAEVRADARDAQQARAAQAARRPQGADAGPEPRATSGPDFDNVSVLRPGSEPRPVPPAPERPAALRRVH
jgi:hypothetical protein